MRAFAITWDGTYRNLMVAVCADLGAAKAAVEVARSDGGIAAGADVDLDVSGPALVGLYNALAALVAVNHGDTTASVVVSRFKTRGDGQRRVFEILENNFKDAPEAAAPTKVEDESAAKLETSEAEEGTDDMASKGKKTKTKTKKVRIAKEPKAPRAKKDRKYKDKVVSKGGEKTKAAALEMIQRKNGATAQEIADKLDLSLGSAKNQIWYLRRDGKKIVVDKASERRPYVIV